MFMVMRNSVTVQDHLSLKGEKCQCCKVLKKELGVKHQKEKENLFLQLVTEATEQISFCKLCKERFLMDIVRHSSSFLLGLSLCQDFDAKFLYPGLSAALSFCFSKKDIVTS